VTRLDIADLLIGAIVICAVAFVFGSPPVHAAECRGQMVTASYYGAESGNRTANGERFDGSGLTAAHRTLPFGTRLRVSYRGESVVVRINDRGPWVKGRGLDLSTAAARRIGMVRAGLASVCVERLG